MLQFRLAAVVSVLLATAARGQSVVVEGTLAAGPSSQGVCSLSGTDSFFCENGAFCTWQSTSSDFSCVGGSGPVAAATDEAAGTSDATAGPPGRDCTPHEGHWDCADGSFCEQVAGEWDCQGGTDPASGESAAAATGEACVVHGGHTHGDCSSSCNGVDLGDYDMDLHIVALFVVLVSSAIGVFLPLLCSNLMSKSLFANVFFAAKHFGTGVTIATAFIHLLYHSFIMFGNACLGELVFEPAAAAITLAGTYVVFSIDFFVMRWLYSRASKRAALAAVQGADSPDGGSPAPSTLGKHAEALAHSHGPAREIHADFSSPQAHFDVNILEAGIVFHSIMIGVSLGASGGSQWRPLFVAVVFHQMFEGLALGSRIGQLIFPSGKGWKKWVMGGIFTLVTPLGVGIGMAVHSGYNPNSGAALLSIGVLDAISGGILIYAGLVEMLYHDFMHGPLAHARGLKVALAFFFLFAGTLCMSVLGKWA